MLLFVVGFEEAELLKACCGSGANDYNFDIGKQCGSKEASVCSNPNKRVSWDGVHLTEHAYQLMADWLLKDIMNTTTLFENNGRIPLGISVPLSRKALPLSFLIVVLRSLPCLI